MIVVKGTEPRLLLTTRIGKERATSEEVVSALFDIDPEVYVEPLDNRGLLVVYSQIKDPFALIDALITKRVSRVFNAIPVDTSCTARYEDICRSCIELVLLRGFRLPIRFIALCRKRGWEVDSCSRLVRYVGETIEKLGIGEVEFKHYDYILRIEVVDNKAFLSLYERWRDSLTRISTRLSRTL